MQACKMENGVTVEIHLEHTAKLLNPTVPSLVQVSEEVLVFLGNDMSFFCWFFWPPSSNVTRKNMNCPFLRNAGNTRNTRTPLIRAIGRAPAGRS